MAGQVVVEFNATDKVSPVLSKLKASAEKLNQKLQPLTESVKKIGTAGAKGFEKLNNKLNTVSGTLARIGTAAVVRGFAQAGVEAERTAKRLKLLSGEYGETDGVQKLAAEAAEKFTIGQTRAASAVTDLYGRLRPAGVSLKEIGTVFNGVNVAAAKMNLSTADTEGVMLQLSQALGSGVLQGDEFRSIMERLPSVGQAVAKSMEVSVGELKKLSSEGKITTDVIIKALDGLSKQKPPAADAYKQFNAAIENLATTIGTELLPAITPIVQATASLVSAFGELPGPAKTIVAAVVGLAGAFVVLAPAVAAIGPAFAAIGALGLGAKLAALGPIIASIVSALSGLLPILAGVFTGPVGWAALLVGAGTAIYAFRGQIADALKSIGSFFKAAFDAVGNILKKAAQLYMDYYVDPILGFGQDLFDGLVSIFDRIAGVARDPLLAVVGFIRGIFNNILATINRGINGAINLVNRLIAGFNRLPAPNIPFIPQMSVPQFAKGGVVTGPTLAMVGEGGEDEYIIPQSKAAGFAANFLSGKRGAGAIPGFAEGGFVSPSVSIQTGPVTQMDGQNYVTAQDMSQAVQAGVEQTLQFIMSDGTIRTGIGLS